jgi:AraC-like DNA-binding protein/ligand-binding sensor protein
MKKTARQIAAPRKKTDPLLLKACKVLSAYAEATKTQVCVYDENFMPVPEISRNSDFCRDCMGYKSCQAGGQSPEPQENKLQKYSADPCGEMHVKAIMEAHQLGGICIYMCDLGFMFWTSPVYSGGSFMGALRGSGFLGIEIQDAAARLCRMSGAAVSETELADKLSRFPRGDSEKISTLAEMMLACAEFISTGTKDYHATLKRRAKQQYRLTARIEELKKEYPSDVSPPSYPLDKERMLLASLRRGDTETGINLLNELLAFMLFSNPDKFNYIQYRAIELVVLLSRVYANPGCTEQILLETNNHYLRSIQNARNIEELIDVLHGIVEHMAGQIFSFQGIQHAAALKKAELFIWENYTRKISLEEIAGSLGLSAPYFSTIFKEEMGESLSSYLNRLRVEKASRLLKGTSLSLSEIAGACGFEDQSWFSKIFKIYTGFSPGKYRGRSGGTIYEISSDNISENYQSMIAREGMQ